MANDTDHARIDPAAPTPSGKALFELPPLSLLPELPALTAFEEDFRAIADRLEEALASLGVEGRIEEILISAAVTRFEIVCAPGTDLKRLTDLDEELARLMGSRCLMAALQERSGVGVELPRSKRDIVHPRPLLASTAFKTASGRLPVVLGVNLLGEPVIADLANMHNLLIGGSGGAGKSNLINALLMAIFYRVAPQECRLIMITLDHYWHALSIYDDIPNLLAPVIADPGDGLRAIRWTVAEMDARRRLMSTVGVRTIDAYNDRARAALAKDEMLERTLRTVRDEEGQPVVVTDRVLPDILPRIVLVVEECSELMEIAPVEFEEALRRLARNAEDAGIHVVMTTAWMANDIITPSGRIGFSNFICFQVARRMESELLLHYKGGEQLCAPGDMLHRSQDGRLRRLQTPFADEEDLRPIIAFLRSQGEPQYVEDILPMSGRARRRGESPCGDFD